MDLTALEFALALLAASVAGALLPLHRRWSERGLHVFVALAAGIFLGTIFLHLLPHLAGVGDGHGHGGAAHAAAAHGEESAVSLGPWIAAMGGLLILFAIEKVWLPAVAGAASVNPHKVLWTATYVGLSLHAITAGIAMSAVIGGPGASTQLLVSLLIHKATETFSLATVMRLAQIPFRRALIGLLVFALIEPTGLFLGRGLLLEAPAIDMLLTGFACGTFLYVAVCDLLPEVFHGHDRPGMKLFAVLAGIGITAVSMPRLEVLGGFMMEVGAASLDVFLDFAPFLLIGLFLAALVHVFLKRLRLARHVAGNDLKSVVWAALFGAPLPLCSCSVVPVAIALRRAGASKGATTAFATSTPEVGIDSVAVSFVLLDPLLAIVRPIGAIVSAIASGAAVNWLVRSGRDVEPSLRAEEEVVSPDACCPEPEPTPGGSLGRSHLVGAKSPAANLAAASAGEDDVSQAGRTLVATVADHDPDARSRGSARGDHDHDDHDHAGHAHGPRGGTRTPEAGAPARSRLGGILHYAYVEMLDDLAVSLVVGVLLSGAIVALLPESVFASPIASGFPAMLLMLVLGFPLYVCALTSTPIAAALIVKGLSPGAAFVFLLAGPATNIATLLMLSKALGRRVVMLQVAALCVTVLAMGWLVDRLYPWFGIAPSATVGPDLEHGVPWWSVASAVVLGLLLLASLARIVWKRDPFSALRDEPPSSALGHAMTKSPARTT